MTWEALLSRLAELVGIESAYTDVYGRRIDTPLDAKVPVLEALDFDVSSVSSLTNAVVAAEDEPWRRWIAPWVVRTTDPAGFDLDLFLPADDADQQWSWEIAFEDGATDHGTFGRDDLLMVSARYIDGRRIEHRRLSLQRSGPIGYHRMRVCGPSEAEASLVLAPHRCHVPPEFESPDCRAWGLSTHIYIHAALAIQLGNRGLRGPRTPVPDRRGSGRLGRSDQPISCAVSASSQRRQPLFAI
jgi:(1->4)-alpha-D-glucan 1-alpha-D-glucosylmutase